MASNYEVIFNLNLLSKRFVRESKKAEKRAEAEKKKIAKAIRDRNKTGAVIYSENAIRERNCANNFLKYSSYVDGIVSRVRMQNAMSAMAGTLGELTKSLEAATESFDMKKINQVLGSFDEQMNHVKVTEKVVDSALGSINDDLVDPNAVQSLINQVAEENSLQLTSELAAVSSQATAAPAASSSVEDPLQDRLSQLLAE